MPKKNSRSEAATPRQRTVPPGSSNPIAEDANPDPQAVARLAYSYWEARGCDVDSPEEDWFRAENDLRAHRASAGK